ncbi:hypothetical protein NCC78_15895 [Micromonospora phytophila]|uniref:hypothetical protein n=1 Tax=Micromonospora phytophila TaxID=709888 RepID=UPI00202E157B|nr:hypothetical protein [Micromonospora phytophila]MCM0676160.1 hypothetical protein [Micromonospora phytophila]
MTERGIEQRPMSVFRRRVIASVLTGLVVVAVPAVFVARRNPWHYVHLMPFGRSLVGAAALFAAPVLLGIAAWLVLRPVLARAVVVVATVLALVAPCGGLLFLTGRSVYGLQGVEPYGDTEVVALSPGGSFEVVLLRYREWMTGFDILRIRSRAGLSSREANQDLACFATPFDGLPPEGTLDSARFLSEHEIEVRTEAGQPWTTRFDPHTLLADSILSHGCQ